MDNDHVIRNSNRANNFVFRDRTALLNDGRVFRNLHGWTDTNRGVRLGNVKISGGDINMSNTHIRTSGGSNSHDGGHKRKSRNVHINGQNIRMSNTHIVSDGDIVFGSSYSPVNDHRSDDDDGTDQDASSDFVDDDGNSHQIHRRKNIDQEKRAKSGATQGRMRKREVSRLPRGYHDVEENPRDRRKVTHGQRGKSEGWSRRKTEIDRSRRGSNPSRNRSNGSHFDEDFNPIITTKKSRRMRGRASSTRDGYDDYDGYNY